MQVNKYGIYTGLYSDQEHPVNILVLFAGL